MKPKVLQLVGDNKMGGVKTVVDNLASSCLAAKFEFVTLSVDEVTLWQMQADVIIVHFACTWRHLIKLLLLRRLNPTTKIIIYEHHYSPEFERLNVPSKSRFRLMLKLSYALADKVIAVSQVQSQWMKQHHLTSATKIIVIPPGRNLDTFLSLPLKDVSRPLTLAAFGRFCSQKGFDDLLKAMKLLPPDLVKLNIGGGGSQEAELQELAVGMNNIQFFGVITDVPTFVAQCDAVVIPSRWEPSGTVCAEAKAAGKAVIVSHVDGLTEQVQNCGILAPPQDCVQLAQVLATFCQQSNQTITDWGISGRESVRNAWKKYLHDWESLLWDLLKH